MPRRLTKEQAAIVGAYTGVSIGPFSDIHEYAEKKLGRPIFTHEFAWAGVWEELKAACKEDFLSIAYLGERYCIDCGNELTNEDPCWRCSTPNRWVAKS